MSDDASESAPTPYTDPAKSPPGKEILMLIDGIPRAYAEMMIAARLVRQEDDPAMGTEESNLAGWLRDQLLAIVGLLRTLEDQHAEEISFLGRQIAIATAVREGGLAAPVAAREG